MLGSAGSARNARLAYNLASLAAYEAHLTRLDEAWRAKSAELTAAAPANGWSHQRLVGSGLAP